MRRAKQMPNVATPRRRYPGADDELIRRRSSGCIIGAQHRLLTIEHAASRVNPADAMARNSLSVAEMPVTILKAAAAVSSE